MAQKPDNQQRNRLVFSFNPRAIHSAVQQKKTDFPESEANSLLSPVFDPNTVISMAQK